MFGEEYTLVAVADYVLKNKKGNTVSNLSSTRALRDVTEEAIIFAIWVFGTPKLVIAIFSSGILLIQSALLLSFFETAEVKIDRDKLAVDLAPEQEVQGCIRGHSCDVTD